MKLGTYYKQSFATRGADMYFFPMAYCKNGSAKGILVDMARRGAKRAKKDSVPPSYWRLWVEVDGNIDARVSEAVREKMA